MHISGYKLLEQKDILELLKFTCLANPLKLKTAFLKYSLDIECGNDLVWLANMHATGQDKSGLVGMDDNIHAFDIRKVLEGIPLSTAEIITALDHFDEDSKRAYNINQVINSLAPKTPTV